MWTVVALTVMMWMTYAAYAQEYLPPKIGGGGCQESSTRTRGQRCRFSVQLPANYEFSYDVQDNAVSLDFGHNEKRKEDRATGSYHVLLPDGRTQLVEYEAGPDGYKPQIIAASTRHAARQAPRTSRQTTLPPALPVSPPADTGITQ
ncbi:hypothetical protein ACJJTC_015163 [Scirpophaga incertulas]